MDLKLLSSLQVPSTCHVRLGYVHGGCATNNATFWDKKVGREMILYRAIERVRKKVRDLGVN